MKSYVKIFLSWIDFNISYKIYIPSIDYFTYLLPSVLDTLSITMSKLFWASNLKTFIFKSFITYF